MRDLAHESCAWMILLLPLAIFGIVEIMPAAFDGLGWLFQVMRELGWALRG